MMHVQRFSRYANAYLIDETILIDAGIDPADITGYDPELIILTHCHFDHTCAASAIADRTGALIAIHEQDAGLLGDDYATASVLFNEDAPQITPDILLHGGETFKSSDYLLEAIHTPGHTPGSICIYESGTRSLFSGDTIFPGGGTYSRAAESGDVISEAISLILCIRSNCSHPLMWQYCIQDISISPIRTYPCRFDHH